MGATLSQCVRADKKLHGQTVFVLGPFERGAGAVCWFFEVWQRKMTDLPKSADVVIVGGAAIGSSIAYHLAAHPQWSGSILVVEKDPTYARAASALKPLSLVA